MKKPCGADQADVGERLREVSQGLAAAAGLFGVEAKMIGIAEHLFEKQPGIIESGGICAAGAGEGFDKPEGAHVEGPFHAPAAHRGAAAGS